MFGGNNVAILDRERRWALEDIISCARLFLRCQMADLRVARAPGHQMAALRAAIFGLLRYGACAEARATGAGLRARCPARPRRKLAVLFRCRISSSA